MVITESSRKKEITLSYFQYNVNNVNGHRVYTFFILCEDYKELPLDPNPRNPVITSAPYKDMCKTLKDEPHLFFLKNGGINAIANKVDMIKSDRKAILSFERGWGIINGGHTQLAILNSKEEFAISSEAIVRLEVIETSSMKLDVLVKIAEAKNSSASVLSSSIAHLQGHFKPIIKEMKPEYEGKIRWHEGREIDGRSISATDLISMLNMFDVDTYNNDRHPIESSNTKTKVFNEWKKSNDGPDPNSKLAKIYHLTDDIIDLSEYIESTCTENLGKGFTSIKVMQDAKINGTKSTIVNGYPLRYNVPRGFLLPMLAAFRANLQTDEDGKLEWIENPKDVFDRVKKKLTDTLREYMKNHDNLNKISKDSMPWRVMYDIVKEAVRGGQ